MKKRKTEQESLHKRTLPVLFSREVTLQHKIIEFVLCLTMSVTLRYSALKKRYGKALSSGVSRLMSFAILVAEALLKLRYL